MTMNKATLIKATLKNTEGYKTSLDDLLFLIDLPGAKILSTNNFTLVDSLNWNFAFVYQVLPGSNNYMSERALFIIDSNCNLVNFVEINGWKLILENQYAVMFQHQFVVCDPTKDFLEKKYKILGKENYIKELIFNVFIPLTKFKSLAENAMDQKLDYIIELLKSKNVIDSDNTQSIPEG